MFNLSPKNDKFFDLFIEYSEIILKSGEMLKAYIEDPSSTEEKFKAIKDVEHKGDEMLHVILGELGDSFITPIDREDIHAIGNNMDDILDFVEQTASRYVMYNVKSSRQQAVVMADLVIQATKEIKTVMTEFKNMKKNNNLTKGIDKINAIENEGDVTFRSAVRELFDNKESTLEIIVWKDIYECLENILDACEDVANIVEGVVMKHA